MSGQQQAATAAADVTVPMMYMVDTGVPPVFDQSASAADPTRAMSERVPQPMTVRDARRLPNSFSLDVEGFAFAEQPTRVTDFRDDAQLAAIYTPEVEALIARLTGATKVVVFDHTRRSSDGSTREAHNWRPPVPLPHSDYTAKSAEQRLRDALGDAAEARLKKRFAIVNTWRSTTGTVEQWPMAVCDARSVDDTQMHMIVRSAPHRTVLRVQPVERDAPRLLRPEAPLVLVPAHDARRGAAVQELRHADRRHCALRAALGLRGPDGAAGPGAAREHREPRLRLLRLTERGRPAHAAVRAILALRQAQDEAVVARAERSFLILSLSKGEDRTPSVPLAP